MAPERRDAIWRKWRNGDIDMQTALEDAKEEARAARFRVSYAARFPI